MLYIVNRGDSLFTIASRFGTTISRIMEANVICNPNLIFPGLPLIIPQTGIDLPKAGGYPYYVVAYGDSLWCLARQFSQSIQSLATANQIRDPNHILVGSELLVGFDPPQPQALFKQWEDTGGVHCEELSSLQIHGIYYIGSYLWEALGEQAVPYLIRLLQHPCDVVRYYTVISLGRIGRGEGIQSALMQAMNDTDPFVVELAQLAFKRFQLIPVWTKRVHILLRDYYLLSEPHLGSISKPILQGATINVLRWNIPSPTVEEGPRGDLQIYDLALVTATGQVGYLPRIGFNETLFI